MLKTFFNLFLIVVICFLASIIPLNSSLINFPNDLLPNFTLNKSSSKIKPINSSYETNLNEPKLYNPTNIEFIMTGELDKGSFILGESHDIVLEVLNNDSLVKKYINTEFVTGLIDMENNDSKIKYSLDISQENLGLSAGCYNFKIYSTGKIFNGIEPYEISVTYLSNSKYIPSKNTVENGYMYLTLYFPDENYEYLLPVSRKIKYTNKTIRASINNLLLGPNSSLGLSSGSPIPEVPSIWVRKKTAYLNLPRNIGKYDQGSTISQFALNSLVNTLTTLGGVDRVKFLKGGKEVETFFHGTYVREPFERNNNPKVFLGLDTSTERLLLVPIELHENNIDINDLVPTLFNSLKTGIVNDIHHKNLLATIPNNVELLSFEYDNNNLTLNLNNDFLNAYGKRSDIQSMMLDSILYSFNSIPEVNKISIIIDGNKIDSFNNIDISKPLSAPKYINVEQYNKDI
ncbi:GerMN domain-containing protein [Paramaledivibacter caminithermalis]|jgi:spore germination protein GerM|uniref:Sporulation and spore germination n=1 Tax=Paramaledivibacter caminithermalis (strain DSM 15212 / CIP 107654 / DViRD3) TaxID=1121301 RepID=A0A1M6TRS5_PARC5|nr:GerMN domain-containing protein [Paramaledivibacter caminithermalis]SHK59682.1 Sporulation and spore germination [Paramaledivibacter caminithermalis DSM 15212]